MLTSGLEDDFFDDAVRPTAADSSEDETLLAFRELELFRFAMFSCCFWEGCLLGKDGESCVSFFTLSPLEKGIFEVARHPTIVDTSVDGMLVDPKDIEELIFGVFICCIWEGHLSEVDTKSRLTLLTFSPSAESMELLFDVFVCCFWEGCLSEVDTISGLGVFVFSLSAASMEFCVQKKKSAFCQHS